MTDCPFCGRRVGVPKTMEGLCHETPACDEYENLDPDAYMAAVTAVWDAKEKNLAESLAADGRSSVSKPS